MPKKYTPLEMFPIKIPYHLAGKLKRLANPGETYGDLIEQLYNYFIQSEEKKEKGKVP